MPHPNRPQGDNPSTYFVQNRSHRDELTRLQEQDRMLTRGMGGVLPDQPDPTVFHDVLDVGCGTGGWLIEAARAFPDIARLIGIDVSERMVAYASAQASAQQVDERVQFQTMDVLRLLDFPEGNFDLVNERLGASYIRTWEWPDLLSAFRRVARPGGVVRVTEGEVISESSSSTQLLLNDLLAQALHQAGHYFTPDSRGVTQELPRLFERLGFQEVQTHLSTLEYRGGTEQSRSLYEDTRHLFRTILPFLQKWTRVPEQYEDLYQQMLDEMQRPDFTATWRLLTVWGTRPVAGEWSIVSTP